jgi:hypothetical protein
MEEEKAAMMHHDTWVIRDLVTRTVELDMENGEKENIVTNVVWMTPCMEYAVALVYMRMHVLHNHTQNHMELEEEAVILDVGVTPTISVYHDAENPGEEVVFGVKGPPGGLIGVEQHKQPRDGSCVKKVHDNVANMFVVPKERGHVEVPEEAIKKVHDNVENVYVVPKERGHDEVCQEATNKEFNIASVDSNKDVKNPMVEELDEISHENVVEMYMGIGTFSQVGTENPAGQAPLPQYIFIGSDGCPGPAAVEVPGHGEGVNVAQEYLLEGNGVHVGLQQDHRSNPRDVVHNVPVCQPLANNKEVS